MVENTKKYLYMPKQNLNMLEAGEKSRLHELVYL